MNKSRYAGTHLLLLALVQYASDASERETMALILCSDNSFTLCELYMFPTKSPGSISERGGIWVLWRRWDLECGGWGIVGLHGETFRGWRLPKVSQECLE